MTESGAAGDFSRRLASQQGEANAIGCVIRRPGLLFDLDGTLAQTEHLHFAAFNAIVGSRGRSLGETEFFRHVCGQTDEVIMAFLFPEADSTERKRIAEQKDLTFRSMAAARGVKPMPGALELLAWAGRRVATGLVTNAPRKNAEMVISSLNLHATFAAIVTSDEIAHGKPSPDGYLAAVQLLNLFPGATVAVEDSLPGIAAALAAGLQVIALASETTAAGLQESRAGLVVRNLSEPQVYTYVEHVFSMAHGAAADSASPSSSQLGGLL
jgi:HAD superfamily hydrolase (TIGR01509 family)